MLTGNKGEWSEIYTLLKIVSDKKLHAGDSVLNQIEGLFFPIIKIFRHESKGTYQFSYNSNIVIIKGPKAKFEMPISEFEEKAALLFSVLKKRSSRTFSVPEVESFLNSFGNVSLKAKSSVKTDIAIVIHDQRTGATPELGFSIKSMLGSASTLLNAGKTTNFIYEINNARLSASQIKSINQINSKSKIRDRIKQIETYSGKLRFLHTESSTFGNNLVIIDSALPRIVSEMVYLFYTSKITKTLDLAKKISTLNPLKFNLETNHPFYFYKIKRLLTDIALGMMPSTVWTGKFDATGGYLIVKEDGNILCYHIYNRNEFENYLLDNTKFETASSTRHDFGTVFEKNGRQFFKLNLQIRFLK